MRKLLFLFLAASSFALNAQYSVCAGGTVAIAATSTLTNPTYSLAPGQGAPLPNNTWVVSPGVTTTYTIIATSGSSTQSTPVTVTVNPMPLSAPTVTNMTCNNAQAGYNLNLGFNPPTPVPSYTITWGGNPPNVPNGWTPGTTSQFDTLAPSIYTANITADGGCSVSVQFTILPQPAPTIYSLVPGGPNYTLTCNTPTINIHASNPAYTYTFYSNTSTPMSGSAVAVTYTDSGNWSVTGLNPTTGCANTKTFVVSTNTTVPTRSATPAFQTISCTNPIPQTVVLTATPQTNITHSVNSNVVPPFSTGVNPANFQATPGDTYTHYVINNVTGCVAVGQFTVAKAVGVPDFSVTSLANFTIGCSTKSAAVITFSAETTPVGGGVITFTLLPPGTSSVLPPGDLLAKNVWTVTAPGTWTAVAREKNSQCENRSVFQVIQDIFPPTLDTLIVPKPVLDCNVPEVVITGGSDVPGAAYQWTGPGGVVAGPNLTVNANPLAPTNTLIANFVFQITNPNNLCISTHTVPMKQNLFPPIPRIGSTGSLTCKQETIELTMQGSTGIPPASGYPTNSLVIGELWQGPTPQIPKANSSSYVAFIEGVYTLTVKDLNNGCTSKTVTTVGIDKLVPLINNLAPWPSVGGVISCSAPANAPVNEVTVSISTRTTSLDYLWTGPPNVSHTLATGTNTMPVLKTNRAGIYYITVTDRVNGCTSSDSTTVVNGTLFASIDADRKKGFVPLAVEFFNNSSYNISGGTTSNASITSVWSLGNGLTNYTTSAQATTKTVYNAAGHYTVTAFIFAGVCMDTAYQYIDVDFASSLEVPNIFSPNGDNINDILFLKAVNLSEITLQIYNRWGAKIYSLTSDKGNIAWDGSNQFGDPADEGVYLYTIQAKGTDGQLFDQKGNITLVR